MSSKANPALCARAAGQIGMEEEMNLEINWPEFLASAESRTDAEWDEAQQAVQYWEGLPAWDLPIDRDGDGAPDDLCIRIILFKFAEAIESRDVEIARLALVMLTPASDSPRKDGSE